MKDRSHTIAPFTEILERHLDNGADSFNFHLMQNPDFQSFMLPLLRTIADGEQHRVRDLYEPLAGGLGLDDGARRERLPSGKQPIYQNRMGWAKT